MTLAPDPVLLDVSAEGVAIVTLNRPERRNALDGLMIAALAEAFETLKGADHVRIVFVRGAGESFCAGADTDWLRRSQDHDLADNEADDLAFARMLRHLHELPQITVALVRGATIGAGAGLVAACDVVAAMNDAAFQFADVRLGFAPAIVAPFVVDAIGKRRAKALLASAESFDAAYAEKIGLVHYVVDSEAGLEALMESLIGLAMAAAPGAVAETKAVLEYVGMHRIDDVLSKETARRAAHRRASAEGREGLAAFLAERKPEWDR